jgi:hypothetical protein
MRRAPVVLCFLAIAVISELKAQPTITATQSALGRCSYETCAIRLDRSFFGGRRVMIGLEGVDNSMGLIGGGLVNAVDRVPAALAEAQSGRRNSIKAQIFGVVGVFAVAYSLQSAYGTDPLEWNDGAVFGALAVGSAATVTGLVQAMYAERHFSRAVWLYNRELPR